MPRIEIVDPEALNAVLSLMVSATPFSSQDAGDHSRTVGFDPAVIARVSYGSDPLALTLRAGFIVSLLRRCLLDRWNVHGKLSDTVLHLAARWPLESISDLSVTSFCAR